MTLEKLLESRDVSAIAKYMSENDLVLDGNKIAPRDENAAVALKAKSEFWNQRQQAR